MVFEVTILGSNSAMPAYGRHLSAQVVNVGGELFLIDCGDGTQGQLMDFKIKTGKISRIFISHLHGDHIFGLIGLLMTYDLMGRQTPLHIYSPAGLKPIIDIQMEAPPAYELYFHTTNPEESALLFENSVLKVHSIPLVHRVPCHGFLFEEKQRPANIRKEKLQAYNIPYQQIPAIKAGGDFQCPDGTIIPHEELTIPAPAPRKFAYCSDTTYAESILPLIQGVDLLYHEATFMHDLLEQAEKTMHSTAQQAATIAAKAGAKKLVLGHFSSRYRYLDPLLKEAKAVFENSSIAVEGKVMKVGE